MPIETTTNKAEAPTVTAREQVRKPSPKAAARARPLTSAPESPSAVIPRTP